MLSILALVMSLFGADPAAAQGCGQQNPNCIVPTAPVGTSNGQAASTEFVNTAIGGAPIVPSPLTKTDDTNVTVTLGGTPATALLQPVSLTFGWAGTLAVTRGGTGLGSGTSGGIPYFNTATTIASSGVLGANQLVLGGGAGVSPATLGSLGTTTTVLHGNAAGVPSYGAVALATDVSGQLPNANLANMAAKTVKSNNTAGLAAPVDNTTLPTPFSAGTSLYPVITGFEFDANSSFGANTVGAKLLVAGTPAATASCCTWLNTYLSGVDATGQVAVYGINPIGIWGSVFAVRSSDNASGTPQNVIATNSIAVHDKVGVGHQVWAMYNAMYVTATATAGHYISQENSIFNAGGVVNEDPFNVNPVGGMVAYRADCANDGGGGHGGNNCSAAIDIANNGNQFRSGIVFGSTSLDTGASTNPPAVALPRAYSVTWYSAAATPTAKIFEAADALLHVQSPAAVLPSGGAPSVGTCTGLGATGTCTLATGANNNVGRIILTVAGAGPAATGNITITFSASIGPNLSQCTFTPQNASAGWTAPVTFIGATISASSFQFSWTNGAALAAGQTYNIGYTCFGY